MKMVSTQLGQKWWYVLVVIGLSTIASKLLLRSAGIEPPETLAQYAVEFLCFVGFWRIFDFLGWVAVLLIAPSSTLLDPRKR